ncbi:transglutaminase domain-containing protein [Foetidibacter luteolus]|uniref:transglutaminase domain-containing protein n=1 Tax=Foetidibacter luteolus TaxID=2608880 RepID=UPI00129BEE46|nr:transglutaminase domain-containing protein [Foetidibacter luteolus]
MKAQKLYSWKKVLAQLLLLGVPTVALAFFLLWGWNKQFNILQNDYIKQTMQFAVGMGVAIVFYGYRFRFLTTAAILGLLLFFFYQTVNNTVVGEFEMFFVTVQMLVLVILFSLGWLVGYGLSRSRILTIAWSVFLLVAQVVMVSKTTDIKAATLISAFIPAMAYSVYIIYTSELIRNMNDDDKLFGWFLFKRLLGFAIILAAILLPILYHFKKDFEGVEKEWANAPANYDKNGSNSENMTKENRDGSLSNKDQTRLTSSLNKGKRLVFVARLDNFFKDGKTPNPLYYTAYYYSKFDTLTQTFETDSLMPKNDLFRPNPSRIPLYFAKTDSNVIKNTAATLNRKVVTTDVYKVLLSPDEYIAPSTSFFVQPLPVPNEYKDQFKSAYRAKMWVSDLNSAYFIYNPAGNQQLEAFQQQRFDMLRRIKQTDYTELEKKFMQYYTFMPRDEEYAKIKSLALDITKDAKTPVDKMIAIRDYFLSKDEFGQPLFKYSDNPGIPGLPSANKLTYFLLDNRKGYCAYFAGATLFMLRALGIPSRVAAGFLTVDRSSKNPGWYWFYEDQAHAWVQVYFPGYGWIDFDTTVPDVNTQQASQPDGTPPLNMQQAYFVADGNVVSVDTVTKRVVMDANKLLFHDENYETQEWQRIELDVSVAAVSRDTGSVRLSALTKGMHITAASFAEALKNLKPSERDSMQSVLKKVPKPVPIDEIKIIDPEAEAQQKKKQQLAQPQPIDWIKVLWLGLITIGGLALIIISIPWLIWKYLYARAKGSKDGAAKAFNSYRAAIYYLNQLGYPRTNQSPEQFATVTDAQFNTQFRPFSRVYQKLKYSNLTLTASEAVTVDGFIVPFVKQVRSKVPFKTRFAKFLNIYNTIQYFQQPKIS